MAWQLFWHPINTFRVLVLVLQFCLYVSRGVPPKLSAPWLQSLEEVATEGRESLPVESCICLIDRIQGFICQQQKHTFSTAWDRLADSNPSIPHVCLVTDRTHCRFCKCDVQLEIESRQCTDALLYSSTKGPQRLTWMKTVCKQCQAFFYHGWCSIRTQSTGMRSSVFHCSDDALTGDSVFCSTPKTSFDVSFMVECDYQFLYNGATFNGIARAYNAKHRALFLASGRQAYVEYLDSHEGRWLTHERLGDAWFKWTASNFLRSFDALQAYDLGPQGADLDKVLLQLLPEYENAFERKFARHQCDVFGCKEVLIGDGHVKCRRFVCATTNMNFVAQAGFPNGGYFKGCTNKPTLKSRWCADCLQQMMKGGPATGTPSSSSVVLREIITVQMFTHFHGITGASLTSILWVCSRAFQHSTARTPCIQSSRPEAKEARRRPTAR